MTSWRESFKNSLGRRFLLRVHMSLIVLGVVCTGLLASVLLHGVGLHHMGARYFLAVLAGYLAFFILIRVWLVYLTRGAHPVPDEALDDAVPDPPDLAPASLLTAAPRQRGRRSRDRDSSSTDYNLDIPSTSGGSGGSSGSSGGGGFDGDGEGIAVTIAIVILAAAVLILFGTAVYLIWEAPVILGEAAVEVVLAASLASTARRMDTPGWSGSILKTTWKPVLAVLVLMTIGGTVAHEACPRATRLPDILNNCE